MRPVLFAGLIVLSGCNLVGGQRCGVEARSVGARGSFTSVGTGLVSAEVSVSEAREQPVIVVLDYQVKSPTLKGHVAKGTLVDSTESAKVIVELALAGQQTPFVAANFIRQPLSTSSPDLTGLFNLVVANKVTIRLVADGPAGTVISIPLTTYRQSDWAQPYCS